MENNETLTDTLLKVMSEQFDKMQERPNQYVVGIFRVDNDELLGYHLDTFCNTSMNILHGKRYSGDNPYAQLGTIFKNLTDTFENYPHKGMFSSVSNHVRESYGELNLSDIYIDAVYLDEDVPKQSFRYSIIDADKLKEDEKQ